MRLQDILDAIAAVEKYSCRGREVFDEDELIQTWVIHHMEIVGEACRGLSQAFRAAHPEVPWGDIAAMRNVLAHVYFGISLEKVWAAVEDDLPELKSQVQKMLNSAAAP